MKYFLWILTLTSACSSASAADPTSRPNILYFYVDDMGWGSIGPNGQAARKEAGKPFVKTPNLDKLASQGINFSRAYGATVCSPARSSQQLGFHQGHTFADRNDPDNAKKAMRADDISMGDALSAAGYVTGYWGKWGYGGSKAQQQPTIDNIQTLPTSHGYKYVLAELHHVRAHTFFQPTLWSAPAKAGAIGGLELIPNTLEPLAGNAAYPKYPARQNHAAYPATAYCDDSYAFAALDFVRSQAQNYNKTKQPFFGLFAAQIPHAPFGEIAKLPEWDKAYADDPHFAKLAKQSQQWAAMVTRIDAHFGNILAALEDPNGDGDKSDSVADSTLVVFQSDNGGPGGSSCTQYDANGGLRGNKGSIYEGGIRVPTIMRLPSKFSTNSKLKPGTNSDMVIDVSDLLPTFCELAGTTPPLGLDGVSLAPTLTGNGQQRTRDYVIHEAGGNASITRGRYKLIMNRGSKRKTNKAGGKRNTKKPVSTGHSLYDLVDDHPEATNLAADKPKLTTELKTLLLAEHVTQLAGFANTYHHWTGTNGADAAKASNWSDYIYKNAGLSYMTDDGAPRDSWTALMENKGDSANVARVDTNIEFLGLEIRGKTKTQELTVADGGKVTGRNEVRIANNGILSLQGGAIVSLRWIDVLEGGSLRGSGEVDASLYSAGNTAILGKLHVKGDYTQRDGASLTLTLSGKDSTPLLVQGDTALAGALSITLANGYKPPAGERITLITAGSIKGRFTNAGDQIVVDGVRLNIGYQKDAVTLTAE